MRRVLSTCLLLSFLAAPAAARQAGNDDDRLSRLEKLLEVQQQHIQSLKRQVAAGSGSDPETARVEIMRQQIREVLSETGFRESLMQSTVTAGYDGGFFIRSSDDKFSLKVNGLLQFRWTHYATRASNRYFLPTYQRNDRTGFDVERLRLDFSGHAYSPDWTWFIELEADAADGYDFILGEGWVNYSFSDAFNMKAGLFKIASTRANMMGNGALQFVDRPVFDAVYGLGFGIGVRFWGSLFDNKMDYYVDLLNSLGSGEDFAIGRTITNDPAELDGNPGLALRAVWHVLGDDPGGDFTDEADLAMHESPALDIGFHYAFNDDQGDAFTTRIPFPAVRNLFGGGFGLTTTNGLQINQFGIDAAFKYHGFSATGEYVLRIVDPRRANRNPITPWTLLTGQDSTTVQHGAYLQVGYFLPIPSLDNKLEAVARVGGISTLASGQEGTWEYGAGLNYYIDGNNVKLQADMMKVTEAPISNPYTGLANVNDDVLLFRVQLQFAF